MTSPDIASSIEDPSPTIPELVNDALGMQLEGRFGYGTPDRPIDTFQSMGGALVLKRLLPTFDPEAIYSLRDAITRQNEVAETTSGTIVIRPTNLFSQWVQKLRSKNINAPEQPIVDDSPKIEITSPIIGVTEQAHFKTYPESHALMVRRSAVSGSFLLNDVAHEFDPKNAVIEVAKLSYDPNDYYGRISAKGRRYLTYMPAGGDAYRSKQFGGEMTDRAIQNDRLHSKTLEEMMRVLEEIQTSPHIIRW